MMGESGHYPYRRRRFGHAETCVQVEMEAEIGVMLYKSRDMKDC
jgi:hypothetical protein